LWPAAADEQEGRQRSGTGCEGVFEVAGELVLAAQVLDGARCVNRHHHCVRHHQEHVRRSSSNDAGSSGGGATTSANGKTAAGIGTPVRDGKFEFTVTAVDPGKSTIGTGSISKTAQGQFVLVHVTVRNIGNQQQSFDQSSQKMIDQQGRQLSPDTTAGVYVDPNNFLAQINPGNSVEGLLVYDIPKDAVPTKLQLHDSPFSGGVTVQLK